MKAKTLYNHSILDDTMKHKLEIICIIILFGILFIYGCENKAENNGIDAENDTSINETINLSVSQDNTIKNNGNLTLSFIDVRHGDSIFVQTQNNKTLLIDGGYNDQGPIVLKYLKDQGVGYYLDSILLTHSDRENVGGLGSVLFNIAGVSGVYDNGQGAKGQSYRLFKESSMAKGNFNIVTGDAAINLDENIDMQIIVPYTDGYFNNTNDNSLVVKITYGDVSFLLAGDCGFECEKKIMGHDLKADVLKVAHSGANDSTSQQFLDKVKPKIAIISTGNYIKFGHPHDEVVERLMENDIEVLRTDHNGTIVVKTDGDEFTISAAK